MTDRLVTVGKRGFMVLVTLGNRAEMEWICFDRENITGHS